MKNTWGSSFDRIKSLLNADEQSVDLERWAKSQEMSIVGRYVVLHAAAANYKTKWLDIGSKQ